MEQSNQTYALSPQQKRSFQLMRSGGDYYGQCTVSIEGPLDTAKLMRCLDKLVERHEILRTVYRVQDNNAYPIQVVEPFQPGYLQHMQVLQAELREESAQQYQLTLHLPLLATDSISLRNIVSELARLYADEEVSDIALQYGQFATWQQELLDMPEEEGSAFWKEHDAALFSSEIFPYGRTSAAAPNIQVMESAVDEGLNEQILHFCERYGCNTASFLAACFAGLLHRYTRGAIHFGYVINERDYAPLQSGIGNMSRTLPFYLPVAEGATFTALLAALRERYENILTWKEAFDPVITANEDRPAYYAGYEYLDCREKIKTQEVNFEIGQLLVKNENFVVKAFAQAYEKGLYINWYFDENHITSAAVTILRNQLLAFVSNVLADPDQAVGLVSILSGEEHALMMEKLNFAVQQEPIETLVPMLREQVERYADEPALIFNDGVLSYREMHEMSDQLAYYLIHEQGVLPGDHVGLLMGRSEWTVIGILGILKARAAFIPLEFNYPADRVKYIVEDSGAVVWLATDASLFIHFDIAHLRGISLPDQWALIKQSPVDAVGQAYSDDDVAYIIYTSGTTGKPKGVKVGVRSFSNYVNWANRYYFENAAGQPFAFFTSLSFDLTLTSIFSPLLRGSAVVIVEAAEISDALTTIFRPGSGIHTVKLTPSHISMLSSCGILSTEVALAIVGGEALTGEQVGLLRKLNPQIRIFNEYGPTEATVGCIVKEIKSADEKITIGHPIVNADIYIVDESMQLLPVGVTGEICIGGEVLAHGYLNATDADNGKFRENPFRPGTRLYKTGDAGRWLETGDIDYIGRIDRQLKIRGHRIEPAEIEEVLLRFEGIKQVTVVATGADRSRLTAYYAGPAVPDDGDIISFLKRYLPVYMIPGYYVRLEAFPLTSNGKVDYSALPDPATYYSRQSLYQPPHTLLEWQLTKMWQEVMEAKRISINDNFFELGGHSIRAIRIISRIYKELHVKMSLREYLSNPTIRELSAYISTLGKSGYQPIVAVEKSDVYPLSPAQKRLWVLDQLDGQTGAYNMTVAYTIHGALQPEILKRTFAEIISRHDSLRTTFSTDKDEPVQVIHPFSEDRMDWEYIAFEGEENPGDENSPVRRWIEGSAITPFNLSTGPLLRVRMARLSDNEHLFACTMHHIISDGWSLRILMNEVRECYECLVDNREIPWQPLSIQYKDYAAWQHQQLQRESHAVHKAYWLEQFADDLPVLDMPASYPRPAVRSGKGGAFHLVIDAATTAQLKAYAEKKSATVFMVLLTTLDALLYRYTGQNDFVIGVPVAGREQDELAGQVGFYLNLLALRTRISENDDYAQLLEKTRETTLSAFAHQAYPFDMLVNQLNPDRDISRSPLFDILLSFDNTSIENSELSGLGNAVIQPFTLSSRSNKYDLAFYCYEYAGELQANIEFSRDLFSDAYIERLSRHFVALMKAGIENDSISIHRISYMGEEEQRRLIEVLNKTEVAYPRDITIKELFEKMAAACSDKVAVWDGAETFTYEQINKQSNRIARLLQQKGIGKGGLVALMTDRSVLMITGVLGIVKAGAAWVPVDPEYPADRIRFILEDSRCALLLTDRGPLLSGIEAVVISPENIDGQLQSFDTANISGGAAPDDTAYVIYTSGSTGTPKGVMVRHFNLMNFFTAMDASLGLDAGDTLLAITSISFDISILELFWTLCRGTGIVIKKEIRQVEDFNIFLKRSDKIRMEFSLFFFASYQEQAEDKYRLLFDAVEFADNNGFEAVWTPERHFHQFGGIFPNPAVISAAIAARTHHLNIRAGSLVLPLHDVVRAAEEWAVVDNISGGRVSLSMTYGWHADDFVFNPEAFADRKAQMYTQIEAFKTLWKGGLLHRKNGMGKEIAIKIFPAPVQADIPVWLTSSGSADTFKRAGEIGANILTHFLGQDLEELDKNIRLYKQALADNGHSVEKARISIMLHTFLGEDMEQVRREVEAPFKEYLLSNADLRQRITATLNRDQESKEETSEWWKEVAQLAFDRYWQTAALLGTPDSCDSIVQQLAAVGVTEIACLVDFGVAHDKIMEGLKTLSIFKDNYSGGSQNTNKPAITVLQTTPSLLKNLWADNNSRLFLQSLKKIIAGGEALPEELLRDLHAGTNATVYNVYGPTETTIWSTVARLTPHEPVNAGRPVANTLIYVLDKHMNLVPEGIPGEIYIGGEGVAAGYLYREELTRERFVPDPFRKLSPGLLYRTGDIGRWQNGNLEIIGRTDNQIKLRGYRIELGEIEKVLLKHPAVTENAVILEKGTDGSPFISAYCVMKDGTATDELRSFLLDKLPGYMVPAQFTATNKLPLTPNGKTDRKALAALRTGKQDNRGHQEPRNDKEILLAGIWKTVFNREEIGIYDDFFEMGGDSIKAIQILSRLQVAGYKLELRNILQYPYISDLATILKKTTRVADNAPVTGKVLLTPVQHWFFELPRKQRHHYNQAVVLQLDMGADVEMMKAIFSKIQEHHDALRLVFSVNETGVTSFNNLVSMPLDMHFQDLRSVVNPEEQLQESIEQLQAGIDMENGPLMKPGLFLLTSRSVLVIVIHHLVIDGISWRILFEDINSLYQQYKTGAVLTLPAKTDSYKHWAEKLQEYSNSRKLLEQKAFWRSQEESTISAFAADHPSGINTGRTATRLSFSLSAGETQQLLTQANKAFNTEITEILVTSLVIAMAKVFGHTEVLLAMESHGREHQWEDVDISRSVGWFTSLYPLLIAVDSGLEMGHIIKAVKEQMRAVPDKGMGYGVLRYLTAPANKSDICFTQQPQICFNYLGQFATDLDNSFFRVEGDEGFLSDPDDERDFELEITGIVVTNELQMTVIYPQQRYESATMKLFMTTYQSCLQQMVVYCTGRTETELTPSDLTYKGLSMETLDTINELFN